MERALCVCSTLVGRDAELDALEDALLGANRGEGQIMLIAGEAGLGKSRLATEVQKRALRIGMTVLWGGCSEADLSLPYLPFLEAIGNYLATSNLTRVREQLGPVRRELAPLFPQLEPDSTSRDQGDATQAKLRLFEAVLALLRVPADSKGVLIVLEDIHWADASTRELLDYLARRLAGMRMMILGTYRTDELHRKHPLTPIIQGWRRSRTAEVIELQPLGPEGVASMVRDIFDNNEVTPEFRDFLYGRSEGNPFVIEEFLKAALDRGDIYRGKEKWERKSLIDLRMPQTVKDTILLRVERLSPEQSEILQAAAILGSSCSYQSLVALSGKDEQTVQAALHASIQQQLVEEDPQAPGRYRFRHALTREAIYDDMIAPQREQLHSRAADMIANQEGATPMDIAHHLFAANRWADGIPMGMRAAEDAEGSQAYREAAALYDRMLAHVHDDRTRARLLCRLGNAYFQSIDPARAQRYLEEGIPLMESQGDVREAAQCRMILGRCYWERSRPQDARREYEHARRVFESEGPSEDLANAYVRLAGLHMFELEFDACKAMAERAIEVAETVHAEASRIWALGFLGGALMASSPDEGLLFIDESHREAQARGLHWIARNALHNGMVMRCSTLRAKDALARIGLYEDLRVGGRPTPLEPFAIGAIWYCLGYPEKAHAFYEEAAALAREGESSTAEGWIHRGLALSVSALGRSKEALGMMPPEAAIRELQDEVAYKQEVIRIALDAGDLERAERYSASILEQEWRGGLPELRPLLDCGVEALLLVGRTDEAERLVKLTQDQHDSRLDAYQQRMEGRLAFAAGEVLEARQKLAQAAEIFRNADYGLDLMATQRTLASVRLAAGDAHGAQAILRAVVAMADERGAIFESRAARKQLASMGVDVGSVAQPAGPVGIEMTERLVSVLFVDIRGYTTMSARQAPDRVVETVASFQRWARQEIERHYGMVDRYEGDAVMATFNVTIPRLDHALHALQAAIAIRDKATAAGLPVGAGIAVGPAVVGQLTSDGQVSTYGEVTNLASRLQGQAAAGEVLLSEEAHRRARDWLTNQGFSAEEESLNLKGLELPVRAFRIQAGVRTRT